jgi:MFS family permease
LKQQSGKFSDEILIRLVFALQPVAFGSWLPRIPEIQEKLGLDAKSLAIALLGLPTGILITLLFGGKIVGQLGSRATIFYGFIVFLSAVPLPVWASTADWLFVALAIVGSALSVIELGLNVMADQIEKAGTRFIMNTCHGFWSLGIMFGSLIGSGLAQFGVSPEWSVTLVAATILPLALLVSHSLPLFRIEAPVDVKGQNRKWPGPVLLGISLFAFGIALTEGAIADWSAVYLRDVFSGKGASLGFGYVAFAAMVASGRFLGDHFKHRLGARRLAEICSLVSLMGILLVCTAPNLIMAYFGFALVGIGVSVGFPLGVSAAALQPDRSPESSVATLTFVALLGFLVGPVLIGFVAQAFGMRIGLLMLGFPLALSLFLARLLSR